MTEKISCPFCGNIVEVNAVKCDKCNALFKEPELPNIKFDGLGSFVAIYVLTFGLFSSLWFFINYRALKKLTGHDKDKKKFNGLTFVLLIMFCLSIFIEITLSGIGLVIPENLLLFDKYPVQMFIPFLQKVLVSPLIVVPIIFLVYRSLRIIQKYTLNVYNSHIDFNPVYVVIFNIFYLVHFIDTYQNRVLHNYVFFDWKSAKGIMLIVILALLTAFVPGVVISVLLWISLAV